MTDLNEAVLPPIWTLTRRTLALGPAESLNHLIEKMTPTGLLRRSGDGVATSRHVGPSVRALVALGVIGESQDGGIALTHPDADESAFRLRVGQALLQIPEGDDPWLVREGAGRLEYHLEVAVAWTQLLGMRSEVKGWQVASDVLDRQFGFDRPLLRDTAPYNTLERLVAWLGLAVHTGAAMMPDPTPVVRGMLPMLVGSDGCSAQELLERSAAAFPWMPHGQLGREVAARMRSVPDESGTAGRLPEGLSLALVRLTQEGLIELVPGDDPASRVLLSFAGQPGQGISRLVMA